MLTARHSVKRPVKQARRFVKQPVKHSVKRRNLDDSGGRGAGVSAVFAKDTLRCWLRSWKRFVSIAVITLLGVAVLTGIYAGCRDAFLAAGRFYDQQGLHDLQVLSTYGLTDDDAAALRRIDGVQTVQPERSQTVTTLVDGTKKTVTMQEIGTEGLDQPYLQQGKLPNKAGEVAVTQQFLNDSGLKIGGTITVTPQDTSSSVISVAATETDDSNNDSNDDSNNADTVGVAANASASDAKSAANTDADAEQSPQFPTKLTITGVVLDPRDLNNPDGYSGMTSFRSTSSEDYTFFAPSDGVTGNIYTAISVAVTGASDFDTFSDAYDEAIKTVADRAALENVHVKFLGKKGELTAILRGMNVRAAEYSAVRDNPSYHPGRCARVTIDGKDVGVFGQVHPLVAKNYGIDAEIYMAELDFTALSALELPEKTYTPLPKYPAVSRDIAIVCDEALTVAALEACIRKAGGKLLRQVKLFDIYRGKACD